MSYTVKEHDLCFCNTIYSIGHIIYVVVMSYSEGRNLDCNVIYSEANISYAIVMAYTLKDILFICCNVIQ